MSRARTAARILIPMALVIGAAVLWWSGVLSDFEVDTVRTLVADAGAMGPVIFLLLFAFVQPFGLSAHIFILTAAMAWPPEVALPLSWTGSMLSAVVAFVVSRTLARDFIQSRIPPRLRRWDEALEQRGFRTVLFLRLIFFTTFLVQLMYGLTGVRWRDYLLGTALGNLPIIILEITFAERMLAWIG
ncbi:MAG: putative membrane protein YdjX (TVP38/TMEM64 family) [Myxococcota bacterium]|jgi:uncharacterized membrane protein YdjX (TVP38/TMEM64 family)